MVSTIQPDDIFVFGRIPHNLISNSTSVCSTFSGLQHTGIFYSSNPVIFVLLLMLQMSIASGAILLTFYLLRPLGHPVMLAQILGGIMVRPSFLCRIRGFLNKIFPMEGSLVLDIVSAIGLMFYFFLGVQTDLLMLKKITRKTFAIGVFTVAVPMLLTISSSILWMHFADPNGEKLDKLPVIAEAESTLSLPIIAYFLSELRIINSDFGRVAICSSMVGTLCSFCVMTSHVLWSQSGDDLIIFLQAVCYGITFAALMCFILGPLLVWEMRQASVGHPLRQGPSFGSVLVEKLDIITNWMLMPLYFEKFGLTVDIFALSIKTYFRMLFFAFIGACGKFLRASLSALSCQMPPRDAVSLGFVMTFQGILELGLFKLLYLKKIIDGESYAAMCAYLLITAGVITPVVRCFCYPSRYEAYHGRTVMHSRPNSELRITVCIHDHENVPSAINLLALNPCKQSPIAVYTFNMIELMGSATPLLIRHKSTRRLCSRTRSSGPVINAFKNFEQNHAGHIFIAVSTSQTMHDDVCTLALDKGTSLVIIPFYKKFHVNDALHSSKMSIRIANQNVHNKAPCSVAILVDRGALKTTSAIWMGWFSYEVAVIFLGGADDREALTLGSRMAERPNINLTLIRILYDGNFPDKYMEGKRLDNEILCQFETNISGNHYAEYIEELVKDGAGTASVLRSLENHNELVVVSRRHYNLSSLLSRLTEWNENWEFGVISDLLASSDFLGNTTILVVQQHREKGRGD